MSNAIHNFANKKVDLSFFKFTSRILELLLPKSYLCRNEGARTDVKEITNISICKFVFPTVTCCHVFSENVVPVITRIIFHLEEGWKISP